MDSFAQRQRWLWTSFFAFALLCLARLFMWQIIKGPELKLLAWQQGHQAVVETSARGKIYSADEYPLVSNQRKFSLTFYRPNFQETAEQIIAKLESIFPGFREKQPEAFVSFWQNPAKKWLEPDLLLSPDQAASLSAFKISGVNLVKKEIRFYPEASMAAQLLGFVGKNDQGENKGYFGLEGFYQTQLAGKANILWQEQNSRGQSLLSGNRWESQGFSGLNLHLFLDRTAQFLTEEALLDGLDRFQADSASAIIMNPKTGAILAMASFPSFDPSLPKEASPASLMNPAISSLFEPGSIFKPLVMAMAFDEKVLNPEDHCPVCDRPYQVGDDQINNWNQEFHPNASMQEIITYSDNIGMSYIINQLGLEKFKTYYQALGFGQKTNIDLQGEVVGLNASQRTWYPIDLTTASFGQGIAVTQIQMVQAFAALANNGRLPHPQVVNYLESNQKKFPPEQLAQKQIFKPETTEEMSKILSKAVKDGSVGRLAPPGFEIAAKSGTAQIAIRGHYDESQGIASYIGFAPVSSPAFVMLVTYKNPKTSPWGAGTAAPTWFALSEKLFFLWGIQPEK